MSVIARLFAAVCLLGLALLQPVWYLWWDPPRAIPAWLAVVFALLPLAPSAWNARRDVRRALIWGSIACLLYFTHGVMEAWASASSRVPALIEVLLALGVIGGLGFAAIYEKRQLRLARAAASAGKA